MDYYTIIDSPLDPLTLVSDASSLVGLYMADATGIPHVSAEWTRKDDLPLFASVTAQLDRYFAGDVTSFDIPFTLRGSDFQMTVWHELTRIPYGETISYAELAARVGNPLALRAVGLANGRNPISIIVPCHRVVGSNGKMVGYGGGLARKERLLILEGMRRMGTGLNAPDPAS